MNKTKSQYRNLGFALCSALLGLTAYAQPSASVEVNVGLPSVEIRSETDFYEPLSPYGRWEVVGSYGRCWIPGRVEADWRPYSEGYWQRTDDGWYWVSNEPWAWATYHYGCWDLSPVYGWYWVPQTRWAPAWVSWHSGGGYIGWAPLYPPGVRVISPRAYVFVEERHFTEPVRRSTIVVNNTTLINKTVINEVPAPAAVERAGGRKLQVVAVRELRRKEEAPVLSRQRTQISTGEKAVQSPARGQAGTERSAAPPASAQVEKAGASPRTPAPLPPTGRVSESEKTKAKPAEPRREAAPPAAIPQPKEQNRNNQSIKAQPVPQPLPAKTPQGAEPTVRQPGASQREPAPLAPTGRPSESEKAKAPPSQAEPRREAAPPAAIPQPNEQNRNNQPVKAEPPKQSSTASEKNKPNAAEQNHENKGRD